MASNPITPRGVKTNPELWKYKTTPANRGLGAQSRSAAKFDAPSARKMLAKDIEKTIAPCPFQRYLHYMLFLVGATSVPQYSAPERVTVEKDLKDLARKMVETMENNKEDTKAIIKSLKSYCEESSETGRYPHFVEAFNRTLQLTQPLTLNNAKPSPEPGSAKFLVFINQHNRCKQSQHNGTPSPRKPDTGAIYLDDAVRAYQYVDQNTNELAFPSPPLGPASFDLLLGCVRSPPPKAVSWNESLSSQEHKVKIKKLSRPRSLNEYHEKYLATTLKDAPDLEPNSAGDNPTAEEKQVDDVEPVLKSVGSNSRKRVAGAPPEESEHEEKRIRTKTGKSQVPKARVPSPDLTKQVTEYAAEAMYNSFGRAHVMNMTIEDDVLFVWHFDHECPILTADFNFVKNLPYLFLFLFALQRFQPAHFGFIPDLQPVNCAQPIDVTVGWDERAWTNEGLVQNSGATVPGPTKVTFSRDASIEDKDYCLNGRATWVIGGLVCKDDGEGAAAVMKLAYQEKSRSREEAFIKTAHVELENRGLGDARQYLPALGVAREFPEFSTDKTRTILKLPIVAKAARIPRMVVMPRYLPITSRTANWNEFLDDFFKLIYCHAALWCAGIEHGDISENNMMWDAKRQIPKLCDFDLAHFTNHERPAGFTNTGAWIFMAEELLDEDAMRGMVERLYRHDVESFLAVLVWVMCRYQDGEKVPNPPLEAWHQMDYLAVAAKRRFTYQNIVDRSRPPAVPQGLWLPTAMTAEAFLDYPGDYGRLFRRVKNKVPLTLTEKDFFKQLGGLRFIEILLSTLPLFKTKLGTFDLQGSLKKVLEAIPREQPEVETPAAAAPTTPPASSQPLATN